jgi:transposase
MTAELDYQVTWIDIRRRHLQQWTGRLEAKLARHWPQIVQRRRPIRPSILRLLVEHGSPAAIAADPHAADKLRRLSRRRLGDDAIDAILASARDNRGVRMNEWDARLIRDMAQQALDARRAVAAARRRLAQLTADHPVINAIAPAVGRATACVLWHCLGDPRDYHAPAAYVKALGLNLAERSSGAHRGRLKISKRGPAIARYWLYLAAMRALKHAGVRRYFNDKKRRDANRGGRAVVAVMRRLAAAVHHVAVTGEPFDPQRLFPYTHTRTHTDTHTDPHRRTHTPTPARTHTRTPTHNQTRPAHPQPSTKGR